MSKPAEKIKLVQDTREQRFDSRGRRHTRKGVVQAWVVCEQGKHRCQCGCSELILVQKHHFARGIPKFIDGHGSRVKNGMQGRFGKLNPNYKRGWYINDAGYVLILNPDSHEPKYVLEHRWLMEQHLGRSLKEGEDVHHLNRIKSDNRIDNLELRSHVDHASEHASLGETGFVLQQKQGRDTRYRKTCVSESQIAEMAARREQGETWSSIASNYGITGDYCSMLVKRLNGKDQANNRQ